MTNILHVRGKWISIRRKSEIRDEENAEWSRDSLNPLTEKKKQKKITEKQTDLFKADMT